MIYPKINSQEKKIAVLIDPENYNESTLTKVIHLANKNSVDFIMVGGSILSRSMDATVQLIKKQTSIPVLLFPGNLLQISTHADGLLLLSLISGRNPDLLIGNHVLASKMLKNSNMEIIPTGYILVNGGNVSSVEYMSNTKPIPEDKTEIIVSTAIAGELLGHKAIYLEAGSGATNTINTNVVEHVKNNIDIPLIVGGGLKTPKDIENMLNAGADMIVVGNILEEDPGRLDKLAEIIKRHNSNRNKVF
ncbi:MAG: geranylgeranylglyceryl/heptaprenylglyceryl phosphate synthase [Bacteroidales bacterium]